MSITFGNAFVQSSLTWSQFKSVVSSKSLLVQYDDDGTMYTIFAIDNPIVYVATLYKNSVPDAPGFNQAQNDTDKSDFENNFRSAANRPIEPRTIEGVKKLSLDAPREQDKKPIFTMSPATEGFVTWITGAGDDPSATFPASGRGTGTPFVLVFSGSEVPCTKTLEFDFIEPVEVHDGQVTWRHPTNWGSQDHFSLGLRIPSSSVSLNTSSLGNCNKVSVGPGMNVIVPAAGNGQYDLLEACPVQDKQGQGGYWDNDYNTGAVTPNPTPGAGNWNLFDFEVTGWLIKNIPMTHPMGVFDIDVYKTEYFHPSWYLTWQVTKNSPGDGEVSGWIFCFRRFVT